MSAFTEVVVPVSGLSDAQRDSALTVARTLATAAALPVKILEDERPPDALLEYSEAHPGSVLCMSTHARSAIGQLVWGSVAVEVARRIHQPILLCGPSAEAPEAGVGFDLLLTCIDGSNGAARVEGPAAGFARDFAMEVSPCSVVGPASVATSLVERARERPGAMLAMSTHARRAGRRFEEGSVVMDVLRDARCPVLVVGPACRAPDPLPARA